MEVEIEEQVYMVGFKLLDGGCDATCILYHINNVNAYIDNKVNAYVDDNINAYVDNY